MVKVFTTNKNGKIEFTQEELEKLLNDVWNDGYYKRGSYTWTWASPYLTSPYITCTNGTTYVDDPGKTYSTTITCSKENA